MYTRQDAKNDLNAIANALSREEALPGIHAELVVVMEEIQDIITEENKDATGQEKETAHPGEVAPDCPCA